MLGSTAYASIAGVSLSVTGSGGGSCAYDNTTGRVVEIYDMGCGIGTDGS